MYPIQRIIEIVLAFMLLAEKAVFEFHAVVMSLVQGAPKAASNYNAVQRLHSRLDRKMHTYARQTTNSATALRMLRTQAERPHPNMWRSMKVH